MKKGRTFACSTEHRRYAGGPRARALCLIADRKSAFGLIRRREGNEERTKVDRSNTQHSPAKVMHSYTNSSCIVQIKSFSQRIYRLSSSRWRYGSVSGFMMMMQSGGADNVIQSAVIFP